MTAGRSLWRGGPKPLDVGTGLVCASFGLDGSWLSLDGAHPEHGFVELSALPAFDESQRGRADYVRRYRALMTDPAHAFLRIEPVPAESPLCQAVAPFALAPRFVRRYAGWRMSLTVRGEPGQPQLEQAVVVRATSVDRRPDAVRLRFAGHLDRPALAMITEVGRAPTPLAAPTILNADGSTLKVSAAGLPADVEIAVETSARPARWGLESEQAELVVEWPRTLPVLQLRIRSTLRTSGPRQPATAFRRLPAAAAGGGHPWTELEDVELVVPPSLRGALQRVHGRALRYVRDCTALRVAPGRAVILTDHRLLPLSWTRDAYYQALLLLAAGEQQLVADHLRWLWLSCERPDEVWGRSHHANGARKDEVYQADQQLYPLLELADYWRVTGELPEVDQSAANAGGWSAFVTPVLERLAGELAGADLLPSDENAADDPAGLPYVLANQVLGCYVLRRLAEMRAAMPLDVPLAELRQRIEAAVARHFVVDAGDTRLWGYASDGRGHAVLEQDANDLPTALAPLWGFCAPDDPLWQATMRFACSPANPSYVVGPYGGLGSRHTPGTWSLGLLQEWLACSLMGDRSRAADALARLVGCACRDGMLPEASDPKTGALAARHWFAWPGAALAALLSARPGGDSGVRLFSTSG